MRYIYNFLLLILVICSCAEIDGDYIFKDALIFDGSGDPPVIMDVVITDQSISVIGPNITCKPCKTIDGQGLALSPGFIDVHAHLEPLPLMLDAESALHMGCTTALGGPDGSSPVNLGAYLDTLERDRTGINVGYLIGHNSVRSDVMHLENREPTAEEMEAMSQRITQAMRDGAFGISTGLKYIPGAYAKTTEIIELSKFAGAMGGIYTSHLREEGLGLIEGVQEAIDISALANIPVVLTHHKAIGLPMWGQSTRTLAMVDSAREAGLDIMIDQYPYTASFTSLSVLIPPWSMADGRYTAFAERCEDPILRDSIKRGIVYNIMHDRGGGDLKRIQLAKFNWKPQYEGKTLHDWAIAEGLEPNADIGAELIIQAQLHRGAQAIFHAISPEDVARIMQHPQTMIASDGRLTRFEQGFPHPRVHGTFPRVLGLYARKKGIITMTEAIRKMTSLPAARMGLKDRGLIKEGYKADLVLFDPNKIIDKATFEQPHQRNEGIHMVMVNGQIALQDGELSTSRYGTVLRGPAYVKP